MKEAFHGKGYKPAVVRDFLLKHGPGAASRPATTQAKPVSRRKGTRNQEFIELTPKAAEMIRKVLREQQLDAATNYVRLGVKGAA